MISCRVIAWGILASIFVWTGQASAGWVIDQVVKGVGEGGRQQMLLQANRMKMVMFTESGRPMTAFIWDLNADTITQLDYEQQHYTSTTAKEFSQMIQGAQQMASGRMAEAMKEMEEAMKDMPPEQRKMMEQMMGGKTPKMGPSAEDCREPKVEWRKTGQQATIAGYTAVRYDVLIDGKPDSELWLAKGITAWRELDPKKLERFMAEMEKMAPRCGGVQGRQGFRGDDPSWRLAGEGYPVRTVHRGNGGGITIEVVKAETRNISASEFQLPAGFARKTLQEMMQH